MAEDAHKIILREINLGDKTNKLSLGSQTFVPLKTFLEKDAWQFHEENMAKTFVLDDGQKLTNPERATIYPAYPSVKIVRLAVDKDIRGRGYGRQL